MVGTEDSILDMAHNCKYMSSALAYSQ